jgi:hypothetical protein
LGDLTAIERRVVHIIVCEVLAETPVVRGTPRFGTALDHGCRSETGEKGNKKDFGVQLWILYEEDTVEVSLNLWSGDLFDGFNDSEECPVGLHPFTAIPQWIRPRHQRIVVVIISDQNFKSGARGGNVEDSSLIHSIPIVQNRLTFYTPKWLPSQSAHLWDHFGAVECIRGLVIYLLCLFRMKRGGKEILNEICRITRAWSVMCNFDRL